MGHTLRVGVFAGTFDPVHHGHIAFATEALDRCGLDKIVFLPEPTPRTKQNVTSLAHRRAMVRLAIQHNAKFELAALPDAQFSVEYTLPRLQELYPHAALVLLVGSDVARSLPRWPGVQVMLAQMEMAVGLRGTDAIDELRALLPHASFISTDQSATAASHVRSGQSAALEPAVVGYIAAHRLYAKSE